MHVEITSEDRGYAAAVPEHPQLGILHLHRDGTLVFNRRLYHSPEGEEFYHQAVKDLNGAWKPRKIGAGTLLLEEEIDKLSRAEPINFAKYPLPNSWLAFLFNFDRKRRTSGKHVWLGLPSLYQMYDDPPKLDVWFDKVLSLTYGWTTPSEQHITGVYRELSKGDHLTVKRFSFGWDMKIYPFTNTLREAAKVLY